MSAFELGSLVLTLAFIIATVVAIVLTIEQIIHVLWNDDEDSHQ